MDRDDGPLTGRTDSNRGFEAATQRNYGIIGGGALVLGALCVIPSTRLLAHQPELIDYLPSLLAVITGLIWLQLPWERASPNVFHAMAVVAALETALAVRMLTPLYAFFYFLIAIYIAYVYADWNQVTSQLLFLSAMTCLPLITGPDDVRVGLRIAIFAVPVIWMGAGMVAYLRRRLDENRLAYRVLATETGELVSRIHQSARGPERDPEGRR